MARLTTDNPTLIALEQRFDIASTWFNNAQDDYYRAVQRGGQLTEEDRAWFEHAFQVASNVVGAPANWEMRINNRLVDGLEPLQADIDGYHDAIVAAEAADDTLRDRIAGTRAPALPSLVPTPTSTPAPTQLPVPGWGGDITPPASGGGSGGRGGSGSVLLGLGVLLAIAFAPK